MYQRIMSDALFAILAMGQLASARKTGTYLNYVNLTPYDWVLTYNHSYQIEWKPPTVIPAVSFFSCLHFPSLAPPSFTYSKPFISIHNYGQHHFTDYIFRTQPTNNISATINNTGTTATAALKPFTISLAHLNPPHFKFLPANTKESISISNMEVTWKVLGMERMLNWTWDGIKILR